jgi:hypothetical protein
MARDIIQTYKEYRAKPQPMSASVRQSSKKPPGKREQQSDAVRSSKVSDSRAAHSEFARNQKTA